MKLEKFTGAWCFSRPGLGGRQALNATGLVEGETLILAIEHRETLLLKLQLKESVLIGNYYFEEDPRTQAETQADNLIELNISESGTCLQGFPKGFANLEHWTFERN